MTFSDIWFICPWGGLHRGHHSAPFSSPLHGHILDLDLCPLVPCPHILLFPLPVEQTGGDVSSRHFNLLTLLTKLVVLPYQRYTDHVLGTRRQDPPSSPPTVESQLSESLI